MTFRPASGLVVLLSTAATLLAVSSADAQVRGSERSTISQTSDGTTVTVDYARPHARGRSPIFGGLVPWGHVWTPGANEATTFEASKDVTLNGSEIPAGRYSVWMIPGEGSWEVVLDPDDHLYHTQPPEPSDDQIRFDVEPETVAHVEALTWDFPLVDPAGMELRFRWGTKAVPFRIDIQSTSVTTVDPEMARSVVGSYEVTPAGPPPPGVPEDAGPPPSMTVDIRYEDDRLMGSFEGGPGGMPENFALLPAAEYVFNPGWMMDGEVFETEVDMYFEFNVVDGEAEGFDVRGLEDRLMMRGVRTAPGGR